MPKKFFKTPLDLVQEWPEVFEDMYMNTMPVAYLIGLRLVFKDGRIWELDVQEQLTDNNNDTVAEKILNIFEEYKEEISKVSFTIDVIKLKEDIKKQTKDIL